MTSAAGLTHYTQCANDAKLFVSCAMMRRAERGEKPRTTVRRERSSDGVGTGHRIVIFFCVSFQYPTIDYPGSNTSSSSR